MKSKGVIYNVAASTQEAINPTQEPRFSDKPTSKTKIDKKTADAILAEIEAKHGHPDLPFEVEIDEEYNDPELIEIVKQYKQDRKNGVKGIPWEQVKRDV